MRMGLSTPVVVQVPGAASAWERDATVEDIVRIAAVADELGFDHLTCSEHVAVPADEADARGATYWDPLATLAFLAAHTTRIRLVTSVVVLGYHHPLAIAKRYGTLDMLSGGRLVLGVGVGSLAAEFDLLGAPWADRGARADDAIRALRASLSQRQPRYDGEYFQFDSMIVDPCAVQPRVPIWVGGRTRRSLRRAVELADGWMPFGLRRDDLSRLLAEMELPHGFDVVLATRPLDPLENPDLAADQLRKLARLGATAVSCSVSATSADHYCEQLAALHEIGRDIG
ncbi:LLM class F420-dependent oxidoreductase [Mycolicibacterium pulveris]|nr:LLM class F420-dependent oxidoreductase [Mycolicibacterium pulveris]MCV6982260.1 LLM class F420-dependent oxidoreductase [Mycolicibacterium pulveris]